MNLDENIYFIINGNSNLSIKLFDESQGQCIVREIPDDAQYCTIIAHSYMSDFDNNWHNYFTECPVILLNGIAGVSVERHHYDIRMKGSILSNTEHY